MKVARVYHLGGPDKSIIMLSPVKNKYRTRHTPRKSVRVAKICQYDEVYKYCHTGACGKELSVTWHLVRSLFMLNLLQYNQFDVDVK